MLRYLKQVRMEVYISYVEISEANVVGSLKEGEVNLNYVNISEASEDGSVKEEEV